MKNSIFILSLFVPLVGLTACQNSAQWSIEGTCTSGSKCSVTGKIGGTIGGPKLQSSPIYQRLAALAVSEIPDAALFEIDLSGSSVTYPSTGNVTLTLYDSAGGVAVAARQFAWYRSGTVLRLTDPDSANAWAAAEGGSANELRYALAAVSANANPGEQVISVASRYEGATTASASSTFTVCTKYPSPYQCMQ